MALMALKSKELYMKSIEDRMVRWDGPLPKSVGLAPLRHRGVSEAQHKNTEKLTSGASQKRCAIDAPYLSAVELDLLQWAAKHFPEPVEAMFGGATWEYEKKCFAAIVRKRAKADPAWFFSAAYESNKDLLSLSPWLKTIAWKDLGGEESWGSLPPRGGWGAWLRDIDMLGDLRAITENEKRLAAYRREDAQ